AEACTPERRVAHYTQAVMDLGASVCTRRHPGCERCPLTAGCRAREAGVAERLPAPKPARARPRRESVLVLLRRQDGTVLLERRPDDGIWGGLWGFPEVPDVDAVGGWCVARYGAVPLSVKVRPVLSHAFSHFDLDMTPVEVLVDDVPAAV